MIKYNLKCENNHEFESWFSSSEEFDNLNKKKLLECIYCTSKSIEKSINEFSGKNFSIFKEKLTNLLIEKIEPISKEINKLLNDQSYLDNILNEGSEKANEFASKKIKEMKKIMGF